MDDDDGMVDGSGMSEDENDDGTAEVIRMDMDLMMDTDQKTTEVGPKSGREKRLVMATKKIKLGSISNYFLLEGRELPRELNTRRKIT